MSHLIVTGGTLTFRGKTYRCATGKGGFSLDKREGDGATPLGIFPLRECLFRPDRQPQPETGLPTRPIAETDGWCDDPRSTQYNRPVQLPFAFSHEKLWRDEAVYDLIIPMGYNDENPIPGRGSAIFMHLAKPGYLGTEGCVALALPDLLQILPHLSPQSSIEIRAE